MRHGDHAYPRPQLRRQDWVSLNGRWSFAFDDDQAWKTPRDVPSWPHEIQVPFPPESQASGIGDTGFHAACWYRREIDLQVDGRRVLLHFGAVDYAASVWVDDQLATRHEGGHTPFMADITDQLCAGPRHTITVGVRDVAGDLTQPRGKQDWQAEAHGIWYPRTSGIWQTVWIEQVRETHVESIRWSPIVESFAIDLEVRIAGASIDNLSLELELIHGMHCLARDRYLVVHAEVNRRIALSDPGIDDFRNELLWSPERPTLLQAMCDSSKANS